MEVKTYSCDVCELVVEDLADLCTLNMQLRRLKGGVQCSQVSSVSTIHICLDCVANVAPLAYVKMTSRYTVPDAHQQLLDILVEMVDEAVEAQGEI